MRCADVLVWRLSAHSPQQQHRLVEHRHASVGTLLSLHSRYASWLPDDASFGCEPSNSENFYQFHNDSSWLPYFYTSTPPSAVSMTLRHYQDPFIVAAAITRGCSSSSREAALCFGKSVEEDRLIAVSLLSIGVLGLLSELTVCAWCVDEE